MHHVHVYVIARMVEIDVPDDQAITLEEARALAMEKARAMSIDSLREPDCRLLALSPVPPDQPSDGRKG